MRAVLLVTLLLASSCGRRNFNDDAMPAATDASTCGADAPPDCLDAKVYECNGACFVFCASEVTRPAAATRCAAWGGCLATIHDQDDNDCAAAEIVDRAWIGLLQDSIATTPTGLWHWCDGSEDLFSTWLLGAPDDGGGGETGREQCTEINVMGSWEDESCAQPKPFVCSRPL